MTPLSSLTVTFRDIHPTLSKVGVTHTATSSLMYAPKDSFPSNEHKIVDVSLKVGPDITTGVPPSIVPIRGEIDNGGPPAKIYT